MSPNTTQPPAGGLEGFVPFPADRAAAYRAAGYWTGRTLDTILTDAAQRWPTESRCSTPVGGSGLSFAELDEHADRAAAGCAELGIAPGDRVLLQLPNSCQFAVALFALLRAGAIPVMCLPGHRAAELGHFAAVSQATGLLIADTANGFDYRPMARDLVEHHPGLRARHRRRRPGTVHVVVATARLGAAPGRRNAPAQIPRSPALLLVSGGTTGTTQAHPPHPRRLRLQRHRQREVCRLTSDDVYLVVLPAAHNFPLACPGLLGAIAVGATTVFLTDPSPESAFAAIARHGVTVTALVPALANLWAQATEWEPVTPKSLRLLQVGGAKLEADDARRVRETLTPGLQQVFGMAEGLLNYTRPDDPPNWSTTPRAGRCARTTNCASSTRPANRCRRAKKANCWYAARTRSTATSAPSATTRAASTPRVSTAAVTWSADTPTATWRSPAG